METQTKDWIRSEAHKLNHTFVSCKAKLGRLQAAKSNQELATLLQRRARI